MASSLLLILDYAQLTNLWYRMRIPQYPPHDPVSCPPARDKLLVVLFTTDPLTFTDLIITVPVRFRVSHSEKQTELCMVEK